MILYSQSAIVDNKTCRRCPHKTSDRKETMIRKHISVQYEAQVHTVEYEAIGNKALGFVTVANYESF